MGWKKKNAYEFEASSRSSAFCDRVRFFANTRTPGTPFLLFACLLLRSIESSLVFFSARNYRYYLLSDVLPLISSSFNRGHHLSLQV